MILLVLGSFAAGVVAGVFISRRLANGLEQVHDRAAHPRTRAIAATPAASPAASPPASPSPSLAFSPSPEVPMSFSDEEDERTLSHF